MRWLAALLAAAVTAGALPVCAQQGAAEIRGRVLDGREGLLPGTSLELRNQETGLRRRVVCGADGTYFVSGLAPGLYELSAERTGFKQYARPGLRLEVGRSAIVDVPLELGAREERITV